MKRIMDMLTHMRSLRNDSVSDMIAADAYVKELNSELVDSYRI